MPKSTHKYTNGEVTIVWKPDSCIHSTLCWKGLKEVFDPKKRPWIEPNGATTEQIIEQVSKCPSGALSYYMNDAEAVEKDWRYLSNHQPTLVLLMSQVTDIPATSTEETTIKIMARFFLRRRLVEPEAS